MVALVVASGCQQRQEAENAGAAGDARAGTDTAAGLPGAPAETALDQTGRGPGGGAGGRSEVSVTNSMPHAMIVRADWGEGEAELGKVEPNETKTFDLAAPPGTDVTLTATDERATHSTSGAVTVDPASPPSWTIQ